MSNTLREFVYHQSTPCGKRLGCKELSLLRAGQFIHHSLGRVAPALQLDEVKGLGKTQVFFDVFCGKPPCFLIENH